MEAKAQLDFDSIETKGLTEDEATVYRALLPHNKKHKAVRSHELAVMVGFSEDSVRKIISVLVRKRSKLIVSSTGNPPGFYICDDPVEIKAHAASLRSRGFKCFARAAAVEKSSIEEQYQQGKFEFKKEEANAE